MKLLVLQLLFITAIYGWNVCINNDTALDSMAETCTSWYDNHPEDCGLYDTANFIAWDICCNCIDDTNTTNYNTSQTLFSLYVYDTWDVDCTNGHIFVDYFDNTFDECENDPTGFSSMISCQSDDILFVETWSSLDCSGSVHADYNIMYDECVQDNSTGYYVKYVWDHDCYTVPTAIPTTNPTTSFMYQLTDDNETNLYLADGECDDGIEYECVTANGMDYVFLYAYNNDNCTTDSSLYSVLHADNQNCNYQNAYSLSYQVNCANNYIYFSPCADYDSLNIESENIGSGTCFNNTMFMCNGDNTVSITTHDDEHCITTPTETTVAVADGINCNSESGLLMQLTCTHSDSIIEISYCDQPTATPTLVPTDMPTDGPTNIPTNDPTFGPTNNPSFVPTDVPTNDPTFGPTNNPSLVPTNIPTNEPSFSPSDIPTVGSSMPTTTPTFAPSAAGQVAVVVQVVSYTQTFSGIAPSECDDYIPFIEESTAQLLGVPVEDVNAIPASGCTSGYHGSPKSSSVSYDIEIEFEEDVEQSVIDATVETIEDDDFAAESLATIVQLVEEDPDVTLDTSTLVVETVSVPVTVIETTYVTTTITPIAVEEDEASGLAGGAIAGIAVGIIVVIGLIAFAFYYKKVKKGQENAANDDSQNSSKVNA